MSKTKLEYLFEDLEKEKHEYITKWNIDICRRDFNHLLKRSGCDERETPFLKDLLEDADQRCFFTAAGKVKGAKEEYKNLLERISKINVSKPGHQQPNTTQGLQINYTQQDTEHGTTVYVHQHSPIPQATQGSNLNTTQSQMLINNTRPLNQMKDKQTTAQNINSELNYSRCDTVKSLTPPLQGSTIVPVPGENINNDTIGGRPHNNFGNEFDSPSQDNIKQYAKKTLKDYLTAGENQQIHKDTANNRLKISSNDPITTTENYATRINTKTPDISSSNQQQPQLPQTHVQNNKPYETENSDNTNRGNVVAHSSCNAKKETEEERLSRSRAASAQLKRNNPNIVDLSDSNRPTKLAEKFAEMYDNEWTEAFECLETYCKQQEKSIIGLLLHIVTKAYKFSNTETNRIVTIMENAFDSVLEHGTVVNCDSKAQSKERKCDTSTLEQYLKGNAARAVPRLQKDYCKLNLQQICRNFFLDSLPLPQCSPIYIYASRCVELTWWMCVQDPPIYMDMAESTVMPEFNAATYRAYTKTGRKIDYYVWPALLLEQGGPVLMKGVAQCV